jgi:hypothetical protein
MSSFLPSGVAPISTSMHSPWSSMRVYRKTPSAHTYTYRRARMIALPPPLVLALPLRRQSADHRRRKIRRIPPQECRQRLLEVAHCSSSVRIFLLTGICISIFLIIVVGLFRLTEPISDRPFDRVVRPPAVCLRKGNCWDNAPMESCFGTIKTELVHKLVIEPGMPPGTTCLPTSKDITIANASIPPSAISPPNGQSAKPLEPVSTKLGEGHAASS